MKKILIFVVVGMVALVLMLPTTAFVKGPAEKATGYVSWYETYTGGDSAGQYRRVNFNAHKEKDNRPAKGSMVQRVVGASDGKILRIFNFDIKYVEVAVVSAWFAGECTYDSNVGTLEGRWLFVKAYDGGTPGRAGDYMQWGWTPDEDTARGWVESMAPPSGVVHTVEDGNLQVHTYE